MKEKLLRALKWSVYPAFYFVCLVVFGYLTFPYDRLKDRLLSEIDKQTKAKGGPVVTIDELDSYWISGVELSGLKVVLPADDNGSSSSSRSSFGSMGGFGAAAAKAEPTKDSVIEVKEAHARARLLPLIIGRVQLDFWASVFGGEVQGTAPAGQSKGDVELKVDEVKLAEIEPLQNLLGIPIGGTVQGGLSLSPTDGKFSKATGKLEFSIKNIVVSDGKTKIQGLLAIPPAKIDELVIAGEAEKGVLKITKLTAGGPDLELDGDGKINVREPWAESSVDIYIKFRFTDAYRGKDGTTKSILGEPGSSAPPLIEMQVSKLKKAKRPDGFYGFHVHGKLKKLEFTPSATEVSGSSGSGSRGKAGREPGSSVSPGLGQPAGKRLGGVALPLGASTAMANHDREKEKEAEEAKKEEAKKDEQKKEEEKKEEDRPEDRKFAFPVPLRPEPPPQTAPDSDPPQGAPPGAQPENPGGGAEERPEERPAEEPR